MAEFKVRDKKTGEIFTIREKENQSQPNQQGMQPAAQPQNILGQIFNVPGAAIRSAIQGKGYIQGAMQPDQVPTFQSMAINQAQQSTNPVVNAISGFGPSALGMAADIATNPADLLTMLIGKTPVGGGKNLGEVASKIPGVDYLKKSMSKPITLPKKGESNTGLARNIREAFVQVKRDATDKFGSAIERLSTENPNNKVSLSNIADEINNDFEGYTQEFKNIIKKIPNIKVEDGKVKMPDNISVSKVQDMINYIKTKIPGNIKYQHLDLLDLESSLKASQLDAFPEMEQIRSDYAKVIQPYNQMKQQFRFNRLLNAIQNDFGGEEGKDAVNEIFKNNPKILKKIGGYKNAVKVSKLGKEITWNLLKAAGVGAGVGGAIGITKKVLE